MVKKSMPPGKGITELSMRPTAIRPRPPRRWIQCQATCFSVRIAKGSIMVLELQTYTVLEAEFRYRDEANVWNPEAISSISFVSGAWLQLLRAVFAGAEARVISKPHRHA